MSNCTKVLVLPVYRRTWLLHAWNEATTNQAISAPDWKTGASLQEKLSMASLQIKYKFDSTVKTQWRELQAAKEGSFRSYLYRLAQLVLSREDPVESFLKTVPKETNRVEVMFPASLNEDLVRRRMRLIALRRSAWHRRRILGWCLATMPQLPLLITPLPNVTVYYSVYRLMSHLQAMNGANTLKAGFERSDALQIQRMHKMIQEAQTSGKAKVGGLFNWRGRRAARDEARREEFLDLVSKEDLVAGDGNNRHPIILLQSNELLETVTKPLDRWKTPLDDQAVEQLSQHFKLTDLKEHFSRIRAAVTKQIGDKMAT
ncbi:hypothetical protein CEUSTIGMA_g7819.t1 [Chlamydomonas eustigma]|uniref:Uncharacterized protein n=1 Tax=Chlamydomonas eustigma TaxID=1157962 RepID=A0A250XC89_9CHLO|nr:hypothetical protein CEUSTIGMA_g7819.t1 [Chlamydomonas eustigma]|eukprot:GAX80380.1 hypothetical protein CEUSTIGMA_g7819.t1 [Chlamydomonas eustigma]